jgi:trimethylamine---corrinoid protein Co-methyltransferase
MVPRYGILNQEELKQIHEATVRVLARIGVRVHHEGVLDRLAAAGATVDRQAGMARIGESLLMDSIEKAGKRFIIYGRDGSKTARFGYGDVVTISSPGQYSWVDWRQKRRYAPTTKEFFEAVKVGDALENISIVGAMTQPVDVPEPIRDIYLTAELVKRTTKPTRAWVKDGRSARYILEIYRIVAGGAEALAERPLIETFVEPISPLQMPRTGMEILIEFTNAGLPISIGPMVQASATGPATLAGTLAQENAEILAALVIAQVLRPGTPVMYGGIPHIMDPRTSLISFGSPEQAIMGAAMVQMAKLYGLPAYVNTGLGDSKAVDVQSGLDRGMNFLMGALAGGDLLGHMGISGADQGASLLQLVVDNEMVAFTKRILRGFSVTPESLATDVIEQVGPGGNYLALEHTVRHFRQEFWIPGSLWDRSSWDGWEQSGGTTMAERATEKLEELLAAPEPPAMDEAMAREIDAVVAAAKRELL